MSFTARKIPQGLVESRRFQAKAVWLGEEAYPKYIIPPPASKLDEYLEVTFVNENLKSIRARELQKLILLGLCKRIGSERK